MSLSAASATSAGSTCEMNAQPLISKNGVLLHNGTCQNDRVNNVIKEVKLTLRQEISDSVAMNLLLRETPTDKLLDTLQTFNQDDFIGNLLYIRNKTIYIHAQYGTIDIEKEDDARILIKFNGKVRLKEKFNFEINSENLNDIAGNKCDSIKAFEFKVVQLNHSMIVKARNSNAVNSAVNSRCC